MKLNCSREKKNYTTFTYTRIMLPVKKSPQTFGKKLNHFHTQSIDGCGRTHELTINKFK